MNAKAELLLSQSSQKRTLIMLVVTKKEARMLLPQRNYLKVYLTIPPQPYNNNMPLMAIVDYGVDGLRECEWMIGIAGEA